MKPLFRISTTYSSIAARAISFQNQPLTSITPHRLAQKGLYHQLRAEIVKLKAIQESPTGDSLKKHQKDWGGGTHSMTVWRYGIDNVFLDTFVKLSRPKYISHERGVSEAKSETLCT
jgi:hypothetical protein